MEKVKMTITMELEFPADFIPPDKFDIAGVYNNWNSKCKGCPFYAYMDGEGNWCQFPEFRGYGGCPIKKYF